LLLTDLVAAGSAFSPTAMMANLPTNSNIHSNGHLSPLVNELVASEDAPYESESDLSEIREPPAAAPTSLSTSSTPQQPEFGHQDLESSQSSDAENQNASDDADFDMEDSPVPSPSHNSRHERSSSPDSRRPSKRKLGVEDDEHIKANPELYGLRRSVCGCSQMLRLC
jgi:chromodomain-helicase-DNA-binding protein 1